MEVSDSSRDGEREFKARKPGPMWPVIKWSSAIELALFGGLLVVWLLPGLERPTFYFGMAHGIGYIALCLLLWVAIMRREAPFWLFAATLTPLGPVGSVAGIEWIERKQPRGEQQHEEDPAAVKGVQVAPEAK